jgi:CubicO group peptidase (beta-lactamase class C family)
MRRLPKLLLLLGLALPPGTVRAQATTARGASPAALDGIGRLVDSTLREKSFAGAVVGVAVDGRISFIKGYGLADVEQRVPVTEKTVFRIGSVTKQFTAAAVLRLVDQGKLSLDDPLIKFVPEFPRGSEVTVRQLLSHTSGIMSYTHPKVAGQLKDAGKRDWTIKDLVARIATIEPLYEFDPGTAWSYSNSGYMLLGAIIEQVSGKKYAEFLESELFAPLELADTRVDDPLEIVPDRAHGYDRVKTSPTGFRNADYIALSVAGPAGAIRSTAADLLKWHQALFGGRVLKPETLAQMTAPARLKDGRLTSQGRIPPIWVPATTEYGFGLFLDRIDGRSAIGHGGAINGFNTWMETFPAEKITMVLLANASYPAAEQLGPKLAQALFRTTVVP